MKAARLFRNRLHLFLLQEAACAWKVHVGCWGVKTQQENLSEGGVCWREDMAHGNIFEKLVPKICDSNVLYMCWLPAPNRKMEDTYTSLPCKWYDTLDLQVKTDHYGGEAEASLDFGVEGNFPRDHCKFLLLPLLQAATFLPYIYRPGAQVTVSYAVFGQKWKTSNCTTVIALLRTKKVSHLFCQNDQDQS